MNKIAMNILLERMCQGESKEFAQRVKANVNALCELIRVEELSRETLGLIVLLGKVNGNK